MPRPDLSNEPEPAPRKAAGRKNTRPAPVPRAASRPLPPFTLHWIVLALVSLVYILALLFFPPLFTPEATKGSDLVLFIGRFHPILLHLPIGAIIVLLCFEAGCLRKNIEAQWGSAALFISLINAASSVVAVIAGLLLSREGFEGGAYKLHTFFGVAIGFGAILAAAFRLGAMTHGESNKLMEANRFVLLVSIVAMSIGAHFGANMVHGNKYLTEYAPKPVASGMAGFEKFMLNMVAEHKAPTEAPTVVSVPPTPKPTDVKPIPAEVKPMPVAVVEPIAAVNPKLIPPPPDQPVAAVAVSAVSALASSDKLVFQHIIQPILEAKCNTCHDEQKTKGKLRMDTYELLMQGGQDTIKTIIPGNVAGSLAIIRIELHKDEDEHMPPENKDQLTPEETTLLKAWIAAGATTTQAVKDVTFPPETMATVEALLNN